MASTRTSGIAIDCDGRRFIDKPHRGARVGRRVGATSQDHAEPLLQDEYGVRRMSQVQPQRLPPPLASGYLLHQRLNGLRSIGTEGDAAWLAILLTPRSMESDRSGDH